MLSNIIIVPFCRAEINIKIYTVDILTVFYFLATILRAMIDKSLNFMYNKISWTETFCLETRGLLHD